MVDDFYFEANWVKKISLWDRIKLMFTMSQQYSESDGVTKSTIRYKTFKGVNYILDIKTAPVRMCSCCGAREATHGEAFIPFAKFCTHCYWKIQPTGGR